MAAQSGVVEVRTALVPDFSDWLSCAHDFSTTFDEAAGLPVITSSAHTMSSEAILAMQPDLILTDGAIGPIDVVLQLRDAGIAVVFVETEPSVAGIVPQGDRLRMMFLYLRVTSGVCYLFGQESGSDVLIDALSGVDVAAEICLAGIRPMMDEAMVAANPELILVMTNGFPQCWA